MNKLTVNMEHQGLVFRTVLLKYKGISKGRRYSINVIHNTELLLTFLHQTTCLSWPVIIVGTTVTLRSLVTFPLALHQNKMVKRMELLQPTVKEYSEAIKHNVVVRGRRQGATPEEVNKQYKTQVRKMTRELYYNEGCHPLKVTILPWIQIPLWITISLALRNISGAYPGATTSSSLMSSLSNEGILWFPDMTLPDPLFILPFILSAANIINIEMHSLKRKQQGKFQRISTKFFRVLSVGMGVIASQLPSAMTLYWSTSSLYSLIQNSLFMLPSTKRLLKIPITANDSQTPFRDMRKKMKERANEFVKRQRIK